ncbi:MAG: putative phosphoribosyl transferase [Pseudonocardiales bacterium]|jgi:pimeloyl-ACP methyl ester carboxylesterase|nr:putative phosphoribosyl transferase [Pseudonocardiales bacterium]
MSAVQQSIQIPAAGVSLEVDIMVPDPARGLVVFAHGSGSSRHSPRNRLIAQDLHDAGLATALIDLLTAREEQRDYLSGELRFNIPLLAVRVVALTDWVVEHEPTSGLGVGLFGASTGAAAALVAAAHRPDSVQAVVSRGGRPDLAGDFLRMVHQPTLLIVGGNDPEVIELNRKAMTELRGPKRLEIVPGATHLFEEPGTLQQVARLAKDWLLQHLKPLPQPAERAAD